MTLTDVISAIEAVAPLGISAPWDKSGLQVASVREDVRHMAVCLDPTPAAVSRALKMGADMVLSHHPLSMKPYFADAEGAVTQVLRLLMRADVPLYAAHTSLDANPDGPVGWFAREIGLEQCQVLEATAPFPLLQTENTGESRSEQKPRMAGFGLVGVAPHPVHLDQVLELLATPARLCGELPPVLRRVAVCPGSGASLAKAAAQAGAQLLITGDVKYHDALEAPLPILDVGHFVLEEGMMRRFAQYLDQALPTLQVTFLPSLSPFRLCTADGFCGQK